MWLLTCFECACGLFIAKICTLFCVWVLGFVGYMMTCLGKLANFDYF